MLETFVRRALDTLHAHLIWVLRLDNETLTTTAIDCYQGPTARDKFLLQVQRYYPNSFPFMNNDNPIAQVLLKDNPLVNATTAYLDKVPGGIPLVSAFNEININYASFLPLIRDSKPLGVMVIGYETKPGTHNLLAEVFKDQALTELENYTLRNELNTHVIDYHRQLHLRQMLMDNYPEAMLLVNHQNRILQVNTALNLLTGYQSDELIYEDLTVLFADFSRSKVLLTTLNPDAGLSMAQKVKHKDGTLLDANLKVELIHDERGGILYRILHLIPQSSPLKTKDDTAQRLRILTRASQALNSTLELGEVIQVILSSAVEIVGGEVAAIALVAPDKPDELIWVAGVGAYAHELSGRHIPLGTGIMGWVAEEGKSQMVANVKRDPRFQVGLDCHEALTVHTLAALPLKGTSSVIGVLAVLNKHEGVFDDSDLEILETLSASATIAIQNASLFDQTNRRLTEVSTLLEASAAVTSTLELRDILEHITRRLITALEVQQVVIATTDDSGETLGVLARLVDGDWQSSKTLRLPLSDHPIKQLAVERKMITIATLDQTDLTKAEQLELEARGVGTVLNMPLRYKNKVIGMICLYHPSVEFHFDTILQTAVADAMHHWWDKHALTWNNLSELAYQVLQASNLQWCAIYQWQQAENQLVLVREIGSYFSESGKELLWGLHDYPLLEHVLTIGEAHLAWTHQLDDNPHERSHLEAMGLGSCLTVPLIIRGKVAGIVRLMTITPRIFDRGDLSLCQGIANAVGNALENAALYRSLEQRAKAVEAAYRELEAGDHLKDNLLQNISHELSTPLMHILGYVNLMREGDFGELSDQQKEVLDQVIRKSDHIAEIVRDMVAAYATRAGNLNLKRVKLEQIAALVVRSLTPKAKAANIKVVPRIGENLPRVYVDQNLIGQVFEALLDNAIKFSPAGQVIEVIIRDTGGPMVETCIRDHGIGIAKEEQEKVFMRFYQVHSGAARRFEGTGLGLAIVYDVIDSHGGKVWLESKVGKGTAVYFTVPKAKLIRSQAAGEDE